MFRYANSDAPFTVVHDRHHLRNSRPSGLSAADVVLVIDALALKMEATAIRWRLRPASPDPDDDFVLEAAFNARADVLVTANQRDLATPATALGIRSLAPGMLLYELRSSP